MYAAVHGDMSSTSDFDPALDHSSDATPPPPTGPASRRRSHAPATPRKRRRLLEPGNPSRLREDHLRGRYNDAYRVLFNDDVRRAVTRFDADAHSFHHSRQVGASTWSAGERACFFAALERLGRDDASGIAAAVGTKSIPQVRDYLLLLHDAASRQGDAKLTLRHVPAAVDISAQCTQELDLAADALAWHQDAFDAAQEQQKFGDYWLISPPVALDIEDAFQRRTQRAASTPFSDVESPMSQIDQRENTTPGEQNMASPNDVLTKIPEAGLLQPETMLMLSKTLFMNSSPNIPHPWPHWSEYQSELVSEPSIYRTAFNDLHALVLSVTRRLVQVAITQATSRLRSRPRRTTKGQLPNGKERWKTVARRCAVRVYDAPDKASQKSKRQGGREISWDRVERILAAQDDQNDLMPTEDDVTCVDHRVSGSRATRSGTPLPLEDLTLTSSEDSSTSASTASQSDSRCIPERGTPTAFEHTNRPKDILPHDANGLATGTHTDTVYTLEQFDQHASRQAEEVLWEMLELEPSTKMEPQLSEAEDDNIDESITTAQHGWHSWTDYHASWEEFETPVPDVAFLGRQDRSPHTLDPISSPSPRRTDSPVHQGHTIELRTRSTKTYAALRGRDFGVDKINGASDDLQSENDTDVGIPAQSVEQSGMMGYHIDENAMEWQ
ncbi:hypothetical protein ACN47E_008391 [Coniothyrium glycines]